MFNPFMTKEQKERLEAIALEKRNMGYAMKTLANNEDFKKVFYDFRGKFIKTSREALDLAMIEEDSEAVENALRNLKRLKAIDWFIKYVADYYEIGESELLALDEGDEYAEV